MRLGGRLLYLFLLIPLTLGILVPGLLVLGAAIEANPSVSGSQDLSQAHVARIKEVLRNTDPRWLRIGERRTVELAEADVNLILTYAVQRLPVVGAVEVELDFSAIQVSLSLPWERFFTGKFFNTAFTLHFAGTSFAVADWRIGHLHMPDWLTGRLGRLVRGGLESRPDYRAALAAVEYLAIVPGQIEIRYHWQQQLKDQLRETGRQLLFDEAEQDRLRFYHQAIIDAGGRLRWRGSLAPLLQALFRDAATRSTNADIAIAENRALLLALALYLQRIDSNHFLSGTARLPAPGRLAVTLAGRRDLALHFAVSAAIGAAAGTHIADAAGLFKELKDSQGGSGFSFADLAADRAGSRFAEIALAPSTAGLLQQRIQAGLDEADIMPEVGRLPEGLQQLDFDQRYGKLDSEAYRAMAIEIERRLSDCALYRLVGSQQAAPGSSSNPH